MAPDRVWHPSLARHPLAGRIALWTVYEGMQRPAELFERAIRQMARRGRYLTVGSDS